MSKQAVVDEDRFIRMISMFPPTLISVPSEMGLDWWCGGGAVHSGVERHLFAVRTRPLRGGVRHQWLCPASSNVKIGKKFLLNNYKQQAQLLFMNCEYCISS